MHWPPRPRSTPPLHYWNEIDDQDNGIVVLVPKSPLPNGYGVIAVEDTGAYAYWNIPLPLVRSVFVGSSGRVFGNNFKADPNSMTGLAADVEDPSQMFRSGRGYNILMNRASPNEKLVQEWRMRRPYRRP